MSRFSTPSSLARSAPPSLPAAPRAGPGRPEALGLFAVLVLAAVFVGVLLGATNQGQRRQADRAAALQQRLACEQLPRPGQRRACVVAAADAPAAGRLAAAP